MSKEFDRASATFKPINWGDVADSPQGIRNESDQFDGGGDAINWSDLAAQAEEQRKKRQQELAQQAKPFQDQQPKKNIFQSLWSAISSVPGNIAAGAQQAAANPGQATSDFLNFYGGKGGAADKAGKVGQGVVQAGAKLVSTITAPIEAVVREDLAKPMGAVSNVGVQISKGQPIDWSKAYQKSASDIDKTPYATENLAKTAGILAAPWAYAASKDYRKVLGKADQALGTEGTLQNISPLEASVNTALLGLGGVGGTVAKVLGGSMLAYYGGKTIVDTPKYLEDINNTQDPSEKFLKIGNLLGNYALLGLGLKEAVGGAKEVVGSIPKEKVIPGAEKVIPDKVARDFFNNPNPNIDPATKDMLTRALADNKQAFKEQLLKHEGITVRGEDITVPTMYGKLVNIIREKMGRGEPLTPNETAVATDVTANPNKYVPNNQMLPAPTDLVKVGEPVVSPMVPAELPAPETPPGTILPGTNQDVVVPNSPSFDKITNRITAIDNKLAQYKETGQVNMKPETLAKLQRERADLVKKVPYRAPEEVSQVTTIPKRSVVPADFETTNLEPAKVAEATSIANEYANDLKAMQKQTGGVSVIPTENGGIRQSSNPGWYQDFYKKYKRTPTKADLVDIAHERLISGEAAQDLPPAMIERYQQLYQDHLDSKPNVQGMPTDQSVMEDIPFASRVDKSNGNSLSLKQQGESNARSYLNGSGKGNSKGIRNIGDNRTTSADVLHGVLPAQSTGEDLRFTIRRASEKGFGDGAVQVGSTARRILEQTSPQSNLANSDSTHLLDNNGKVAYWTEHQPVKLNYREFLTKVNDSFNYNLEPRRAASEMVSVLEAAGLPKEHAAIMKGMFESMPLTVLDKFGGFEFSTDGHVAAMNVSSDGGFTLDLPLPLDESFMKRPDLIFHEIGAHVDYTFSDPQTRTTINKEVGQLINKLSDEQLKEIWLTGQNNMAGLPPTVRGYMSDDIEYRMIAIREALRRVVTDPAEATRLQTRLEDIRDFSVRGIENGLHGATFAEAKSMFDAELNRFKTSIENDPELSQYKKEIANVLNITNSVFSNEMYARYVEHGQALLPASYIDRQIKSFRSFTPEAFQNVKGGKTAGFDNILKFVREPGKQTELVAAHNLSPENLMNAVRLGGIPQASIAIYDPKKFAMDGYGDITLIGNNKLVDPKSPGTKTYASDVYSPRQPKSQYIADDASIAKIKERLAPAMEKMGEKYVGISPGEPVVEGLESSPAAVATFLTEKGIKPNYGADKYETSKNFRQQLYDHKLYDDLAIWNQELAKSSGASSKIFGGWTPSGNKRLLDDTIDNALKVMRKEARKGGDTTTGLGNIRARVTPEFKSISDIIKAKDKLTTTEGMDAVKKTLEDKLFGIQDKFDKYAVNKSDNQFIEFDRQMEAIGEYMKGDPTWFRQKFPDAPESLVKQLDVLKKDLQQAPTEYFESVSNRAVRLNEFEKALVPENASPEVIKALQDSGVDVVKYKEGQRQAALQKLVQQDNQAPQSLKMASRSEEDPLTKLNEKIKSGRDLEPTLKEKTKTHLAKADLQLLDKYSPIAKLANDYKKITGQELPAEDNPYVNMRLHAGVTEKINLKLDELATILKEAPDPKALEQAGVLRRILTDRSGIKNPLSQEEARAADAQLKEQLGEAKYQRTQAVVDKVIAYHDSLLTDLKNAGIISQEAFDSIKKNNSNYFTKFDVIDHLVDNSTSLAPGKSFNVAQQDVIKSQKGTESAILSPIESTVRQTAKIMDLISRNNATGKLVNLSETFPEDIKPYDGGTIPHDMEKISYFKDGTKQDYLVPKGVGEAVKRMNRQQSDIITSVARRQASLFRTGVTGANLGFALISNPIRDVQSMAINSNSTGLVRLPYYWIKGFAQALTKGKVYKEFLEAGGGQSGQFHMNMIPKAANDLTAGRVTKAWHTVTTPGNMLGIIPTIEAVGNKFELAPRLGEYSAARRKGLSPQEAAFRARNVTVDFNKNGEVGQVLNEFTPFLNARAQGTINAVSSFKSHPFRSFMRAGAIIIVPAILAYIYNRKHHDAEYDSIPGYVKENNFVIVYGNNRDADGNLTQVIKIPKGEVGKLVANPIESFMDYLYKKSPLNYASVALEFGSNLSPIDFANNGKFAPSRALGAVLPPMIKAVVEYASNYNFFQDQQLVSDTLKKLPPAEQVYKSTSGVAKWIGAKTGQSPILIDNAIRETTGGLFTQFTPQGIQRGTVGRLSGAPGNALEQQFYEIYNKVQQQRASASNKINEAIANNDIQKAQDIADKHNAYVDDAFKKLDLSGSPKFSDLADKSRINLTDASIKQRTKSIENKTQDKGTIKLAPQGDAKVSSLPKKETSSRRGRGGSRRSSRGRRVAVRTLRGGFGSRRISRPKAFSSTRIKPLKISKIRS